MSQSSARRAYQHGSQNGGAGSTINQKAALASAYQELGKELASSKLKMVGNYTLQRPIGEGTFGKVRLGLHRLTNTRVAIKQIPKAQSASLTREIHHHRRLHHPNVMQLYEVIATEQYIWMVSELCAGGELYDYLVENEVLAEPEARRIFGQLCLAVAYVHSKGIVHRDLKLENILLDERCNVKLGDFGFTREFEAKRLMDTFCGTTGYAAPEMLSGQKYTGAEVDVWSLGVILYALLCGALPFDDDDESVMKDKILRGDFEIPESLSEEAHNLVTSILQQDPTKRPSIHSILTHPWFMKTMVHTPMSTVEEDEKAADYFDSKHASQATASAPQDGLPAESHIDQADARIE
uniref:non-specific serine/threonine protein kinase n=1 Tax=Kalmanozyma brasiliensis (strain GHG001) TaxID=1365824 RepID=V5EXJ8_KALBG